MLQQHTKDASETRRLLTITTKALVDAPARLCLCSVLPGAQLTDNVKGRTWIMPSFHILPPCQGICHSDTGSHTQSACAGRAGGPWALLRREGRQPADVTHTGVKYPPRPPPKGIPWPSWHLASIQSWCEAALPGDTGLVSWVPTHLARCQRAQGSEERERGQWGYFYAKGNRGS